MKRFYIQRNVGKAKYVVNYYDGETKHPDGSDFFDAKIFHNMKNLDHFVLSLKAQGYAEDNGSEKPDVKREHFMYEKDTKLIKGETHVQFMNRVNPSRPCTASDITFGGRCLNCGYEPERAPTPKKESFLRKEGGILRALQEGAVRFGMQKFEIKPKDATGPFKGIILSAKDKKQAWDKFVNLPNFDHSAIKPNPEDYTVRYIAAFALGEAKEKVTCDQCEMVSINGRPCHEQGCPNSRKQWDPETKEWKTIRKCKECGGDSPCSCEESVEV